MHYLILLLAAFALMILWLMWNERRMIYYPSRLLVATPDRWGWSYEDVWLTTADGVRIHGWWLPATNQPSPLTILLLHGNAGNVSHRQEKLHILRELGVNVLIIDYRGYGRSDGIPNETGTYADARAAYTHLVKTLRLEPKHIVLYGESLGAAVAVQLATETAVGGVILEEPFASVAAMARTMFPFLPVRWLVRNKYDSLSKIGRINAPLLLFHSRDDEIVPFAQGQQLFAAAREPKRFVQLQGGHNEAFLVSAETYRDALKRFFAGIVQ